MSILRTIHCINSARGKILGYIQVLFENPYTVNSKSGKLYSYSKHKVHKLGEATPFHHMHCYPNK